MEPHKSRLDPKHERLILALLDGKELTAAARSVGIGKSTAWRWMQEPGFQASLRDARRQAWSSSLGALQGAMSEAVSTLRSVMGNPDTPAGSRVSAARAVLEFSRAIELEDLSARVVSLEEADA